MNPFKEDPSSLPVGLLQTMLNRLNFVPILFLCIAANLAGCDVKTPFSDYSNFALSQEFQKCKKGRYTGAGAQRCENIQHECDLRKKTGKYYCQ